MAFELPPLPYSKDALEPTIDAQTVELHHDKHHQAYVTNLNKALAGKAEFEGKPLEWLLTNLEALPADIRTAVRNNGGGHANHSLLWKTLGGKGGEPTGTLGEAIQAAFGTFDAFKEKIEATGAARFGSGWAWLVLNKAGQLEVLSLPNQDSPVIDGNKPVYGVDVWEHSYYLKYQNRRPEYLKAVWNIVNWNAVSEVYEAAKAGKATLL